MESNHFDRRKLEELLAGTSEPEAPPWLLTRIMAEIDDRRPSFYERMRDWWMRPKSVSFSPARLLLTVTVTVCAFWLGTITGQSREDSIGRHLADDAEANYLIGRGLLVAGREDQALRFLRQAVQQDPKAAAFAHWQGVAYWALGQSDQERQSYLNSMQEQPEYLPSLLNLGHNYLENGQYQQALAQYENVLQEDPLEPTALYNRALTYQMLENPGEAEQAFLRYLDCHRKGKWAFRAIEHLHRFGNFTFRSYRIGAGRVVLNMRALLSQDAPTHRQELMHLAEAFSRVQGSELHLVAYNKDNRSAAKETVTALQKQLIQYLANNENTVPIRGSWFDVAESFSDANGMDRQLITSLFIFTRPVKNSNQRNSI